METKTILHGTYLGTTEMSVPTTNPDRGRIVTARVYVIVLV